MTLREVFDRATADGLTHAGDIYGYHGRKMESYRREAESDTNDYAYESDGTTAVARQLCLFQSNEWRFWRVDNPSVEG